MNSIIAMDQALFKCTSMKILQAFAPLFFLVAVSPDLTSVKVIPDSNSYK